MRSIGLTSGGVFLQNSTFSLQFASSARVSVCSSGAPDAALDHRTTGRCGIAAAYLIAVDDAALKDHPGAVRAAHPNKKLVAAQRRLGHLAGRVLPKAGLIAV